ncbi:GPW/gp25 family protein [Campylobacter sputorum]|uniref:GPW/gp25 family protein n=1 Tax=Campylobacter sputorum TaxID=206 RepID=UPI00053BFFF5|nr:GPW/gp25 family protein [Campylobacter sputorum]
MYKLTIEENIKRILSTNKYTKTLRPTFGLDHHIDKRMDLKTLSYLKDDIYEQLHTYEPRIKLKEIRLIPTQ